MLIMNQSGDTVVNLEQFADIHVEETTGEIDRSKAKGRIYIKGNSWYLLGEYRNVSRAKAVLMELFWKYGENQYLWHPDSEEWYEVRDVYQMPKE